MKVNFKKYFKLCVNLLSKQQPSIVSSDEDQFEGDLIFNISQLRRKYQIGIPHQPNSLYRPIHRKPVKFAKMMIPTKLQVININDLIDIIFFRINFHMLQNQKIILSTNQN